MTHEPPIEAIEDLTPADLAGSPRPITPLSVIGDGVRGALIGLAETIPGVSGGTVALITGVYVRVLASGHHLIAAARSLLGKRSEARAHLAKVEWGMLIPLLVGMGLAVLTMARYMSAFVTGAPEISRGLFLGMIAASVVVPILMVDPASLRNPARRGLAALILVLAAAAAFGLSSGGAGTVIADPPLWLVFLAAAAAVCALALPGVSGSFLLLLLGLYVPTMNAVARRDIGYLAVVAAGAIVGLALFVRLLHWLMDRHHTWTMVAMSGLLLGSLRALWPWQGERGVVLPPDGQWPAVLGVGLLGLCLVAALVVFDYLNTRRTRRAAEAG